MIAIAIATLSKVIIIMIAIASFWINDEHTQNQKHAIWQSCH